MPKYTSSPKISEITLSRYLFKDSILQIFDSTVKSISFKNFTNNGTITISKIELTETLEIINSDLGKTTLIDCNLNEATLKFQSSKVIETSLNGTSLPLSIGDTDNLQRRLLFSQIKKIYENRGDVVDANRYFSEEMNTHFETLSWYGNFWEKFNICLNRLSSNHGQDIGKALTFTLFSTIMIFLFYNWSLDYAFNINLIFCKKGYLFLTDFNSFGDNSKYIFEFMNPTHKFDFITNNKENLNFVSSLWDFIGRIVISYGLYQFIAAFRKYGKKSG